MNADIAALIARLDLEDKIALVSGRGLWRTAALPAHGIESLVMTDGTNGVRYAIEQIDGVDESEDLGGFLDVAAGQGDEDAVFGRSRAATCFPCGATLGNAWDPALAEEMGRALALECRDFGVQVLLGPGINLRRSPLAGRGFEYYGEDPVHAGELAAGVIRGLQAHGVGAALKHFACNNSEVERTTMDSVVELRALHELYLLGFERAISKSDPWLVMSAYNPVNGVPAAENHWLLTEVLRQRFGFRGLVVSDWHGIKRRGAALEAGNELDMPQSAARKRQLRAALCSGECSEASLDRACARVLELLGRARAGAALTLPKADVEAHHRLARRLAADSLVLLKNRDDCLPFSPDAAPLLVIGDGAMAPRYQGAGSAMTHPSRVDAPFDCLRESLPDARIDWLPGWADDGGVDEGRTAQALAAAERARTVVVFAHTATSGSGEDADRRDLRLLPGHDALITLLGERHPRVVVVLAHPDAVEMPWIDSVAAVLACGYAGQAMGGAVADVLSGAVNPSGRLSVTYPARLEDTPAWLGYPGEAGRHLYREGIFVGYRYFDIRRIEPLFPFGFGLGYSRFDYAHLRLSATALGPGEGLEVSFELTNAGRREGAEVCQLYLRRDGGAQGGRDARLGHPLRALKAFAKCRLAPGEQRRVTFRLTARDIENFDIALDDWRLFGGSASIEVGASSRDIRLREVLTLEAAATVRRLDVDTPPRFALDDPLARRALIELLAAECDDAETLLESCRPSFLGLRDALSWALGREPQEDALRQALEAANRAHGFTAEGSA